MPQQPAQLAPISRLSLYITPGHNSITVEREDASRQTTGRTIGAMIDAMSADDVAALQAFCANVITYTAGRPIVCRNVTPSANAAGLRRI